MNGTLVKNQLIFEYVRQACLQNQYLLQLTYTSIKSQILIELSKHVR